MHSGALFFVETILNAKFHSKYRHAISTVKDWRIEDRLFDRDEFFDSIIKTFNDEGDRDPECSKDTFEWWNA